MITRLFHANVFIDISKLLVQFIDEDGWEAFKEYYNDFVTTQL